jgi:ppGpp synthetase/RelA/SpoT-type nucleotidyltranferase
VAYPISTTQIDRLGERLRAGADISAADLKALQAFRAEHERVLIEVQARIERILPDVDQSARIKTIQTIHDKLRRQPTRLSKIQDVAGVRIVQEMDLNEQDAIVDRLQREFANAKVVDRRVSPTFGYRAIHVIVRIGRSICEVQVRTSQQHLWAEIVERLADRWGRQIRYGEAPEDPRHQIGGLTRQALWDSILNLSDAVHSVEKSAAGQNFWVGASAAPDGTELELEEASRAMRRVLADLSDFLESGVAV